MDLTNADIRIVSLRQHWTDGIHRIGSKKAANAITTDQYQGLLILEWIDAPEYGIL